MSVVKKNVQASNWENIRQYAVSGVITAIVVFGVYQYAVVRYGVVGLSSLNKSLATSTLFLLGVVLLLGPLARQFNLFDRLLKYRKELGILTFFTGLVHVYLSMFVLARRGPFGLFQSQPLSAYTGLAGLCIMFGLLLISFSWITQIIGVKIWWSLQNWGARIAFALIAFHMIVLKYSGWGSWLSDRQGLPPLALLAAVFAAFVVMVRFGELFGTNAARIISWMSFLFASVFIVWLFI